MTQHNKIYESLVKGPDDAVGAFAYALYKRHKVEWTKEIQARHHRSPASDEVANFHADNSLQVQLDSDLQRGEVLDPLAPDSMSHALKFCRSWKRFGEFLQRGEHPLRY